MIVGKGVVPIGTVVDILSVGTLDNIGALNRDDGTTVLVFDVVIVGFGATMPSDVEGIVTKLIGTLVPAPVKGGVGSEDTIKDELGGTLRVESVMVGISVVGGLDVGGMSADVVGVGSGIIEGVLGDVERTDVGVMLDSEELDGVEEVFGDGEGVGKVGLPVGIVNNGILDDDKVVADVRDVNRVTDEGMEGVETLMSMEEVDGVGSVDRIGVGLVEGIEGNGKLGLERVGIEGGFIDAEILDSVGTGDVVVGAGGIEALVEIGRLVGVWELIDGDELGSGELADGELGGRGKLEDGGLGDGELDDRVELIGREGLAGGEELSDGEGELVRGGELVGGVLVDEERGDGGRLSG